MKKILSLLLLASLLVLALVACDSTGSVEQDKTSAISFTTPATDTANFVYTAGVITGLTEAGKQQETLTLPADATELAADVLSASSALKNLVIGERTAAITLDNGCFNGTSGLKVYIGCGVAGVSCGNSGLLTGATNLTFYIASAEYANFKNDYTWGNYSDNMKKYE